jgi:hypothetical protein
MAAVPTSSDNVRPARDFDGLYKALLDAHPREALAVLCGARLDGREVIVEGPTEQPRQRSRQSDKVYLVPNDDGLPADVYHLEIQVKRTEDFQERMVSYWASLALKYRRADYRIHQVVLWPQGGGYPGRFRRDRVRLDYRAVSVPDDLDPETVLGSPLAALALWSSKPPQDLVERLAERIAAFAHNEEKLVQIELGMLVGGSLAAQLVEALRRKGMNNILEHTESGREIARKSHDEGRVDSMCAVLRAKYGDMADLDGLAKRLVREDNDGNIARIIGGVTLEDLLA